MDRTRLLDDIIDVIRSLYPGQDTVPLHAPVFQGKEKEYLAQCVDSTFVSSVGPFTSQFETLVREYVGASHVVATMNATAALHLALVAVGVSAGDAVLMPALTFVGSANAASLAGAEPVFVDSEEAHLGLCPEALQRCLEADCRRRPDGTLEHAASGRKVAACMVVHVLGHPARTTEVAAVCARFGVPLVEDAAEALGSFSQGRHVGGAGRVGVLSFNGNKVITTGGGGMILCEDGELAAWIRHMATTAKVPHPWEYVHDAVAYNYRLPALNAALGCAQMEMLPAYLADKRAVAQAYIERFTALGVPCVHEPADCRSNWWLNGIFLADMAERDAFLARAAERKVQCRPLWRLVCDLPMYAASPSDGVPTARRLAERLVNIPSGVRPRG